MHQFAQNYPQLMNQALAAKYTVSDLVLLRDAFLFAQEMANGYYRAQAIPLLNHLVTTASIAMAEKADSELVVVALLHAAHVMHHFDGPGQEHDSLDRRALLRTRFGERIETMLWNYEHMRWWSRDSVIEYFNHASDLNQESRDLLMIRLANELDDHLDGAMEYSFKGRKDERSGTMIQLYQKLAERLEFNVISSCLVEEMKNGIDPPAELRWNRDQGYRWNPDGD
jgi:(p)ppGpp synthase/HD superfamily hydrolase